MFSSWPWVSGTPETWVFEAGQHSRTKVTDTPQQDTEETTVIKDPLNRCSPASLPRTV